MEFLRRLFGRQTTKPAHPEIDPSRFPFEVEVCPGHKALRRLEELRQDGNRNGFSPLLVSGEDGIESIELNAPKTSEELQAVYAKALDIDLPEWFRQLKKQHMESEIPEDQLWGEWPDNSSKQRSSLQAHLDVRSGFRQAVPEVYLLKIPVTENWRIPAALGIGGWNMCPGPDYQAAVTKYWNAQYGAELVTYAGDVLEYVVSRPPMDQAAAKKLAFEQFLFCPDIVLQGVQTINNLAGNLMTAETWYFWWD